MPDQRAVEQVAEGIVRVHSRKCRKSGGGKRCSCTPSYKARMRTRSGSRTRTFGTSSEAMQWLEAGGREPREPGQWLTVTDGAVSWRHRALEGTVRNRSGKPYAPATVDGYASVLAKWVLPFHDPVVGMPIGQMTGAEAADVLVDQRMVDGIAAGGEVKRMASACLRRVLSYMHQQGQAPPPPGPAVLPPPARRRERVLTDDEAQLLLGAALEDDHRLGRSLMHPLLGLLLASGLRVSEAMRLRWGSGGLLLEGDHIELLVAEAKTTAGERVVPVYDPGVVSAMVAHRASWGQPPDGSVVFTGAVPRRALRRITAAAGLEGVGFHTLRKTHASQLGTNPLVDEVTLARRLGHTDPAFTKRVYVVGNADRDRHLARIAAGLE